MKKRFSDEFIEEQEDFKWCIENDFKVFIRTKGQGESKCRIVVQRGGITTEGKDAIVIDGVLFRTTFLESKTEYKTQKEAQEALPSVYKKLRERYG